MEVSPLHVVFNLQRVFVGKEYFKTNHLLLPLFDLAQACTLQSKNIVPRLTLKEFLLRCLEKFIVYIWTSISLAKMNAYLKKITKEMGLEINPQRTMGQNLCKINKHFLQFLYKTYLNHINRLTFNFKKYHKIFFDFFSRYPNIHLGNTLLVDDTLCKTYLNPPFNAIFVESYEYVPKEDNYLMKVLFMYLKFLHYSGFNVPMFVEFYRFGTIKIMKEDNVKFWMLFEKCTMACFASFCRNHLTYIISNPNILFCSFLSMFF